VADAAVPVVLEPECNDKEKPKRHPHHNKHPKEPELPEPEPQESPELGLP